MLQYFKLRRELQETKSIVSFETFDGFRVDISKKFLKKDPTTERWYFTKQVINIRTLKEETVITFIIFGEVYIAEQSLNRRGCDVALDNIITVQDLISFQELNKYRGTNHAEETYRS